MFSPELIKKLVDALDATEATEIDAVAAIEFASQFRINIMTFEAGKGDIHPDVGSTEAAIEFVKRHPDADIYFEPATRRDESLGKGKKGDFLGSEWAWADIDPPKGMTDPAALREWTQRALEQVAPLDIPEPQIVVWSGRGLWFYWKLPFVVNVNVIESINRGLAEGLGGDHVQNIDRVARLPFTKNTKTGRVARVLHHGPSQTEVRLLPMAQEEAQVSGGSVGLPPPAPIQTVEEFRALLDDVELSEPDRTRLELMALDPKAANRGRLDPINTTDRSAVMFSWVMTALKAGVPAHRVRDCIVSAALPYISAHVLDPRKIAAYSREKYANRQIESALAKLSTPKEVGRGDLPPAPSSEGGDFDSAPAPPSPELVSLAPIPDDLPSRPWVVEGLLMDGQVTMISGKGGEGKSLLALQLGAMVAAGHEFASWKPRERRNVLLLNGEDDIDELRRRLAAACPAMNIDPASLEGRLLTLKVTNLVLLARDPSGQLETTPLYAELRKLISDNSIGLIIVDPLVETHVGLDENSNGDMKELVLKLRELSRAARIPVLVVHHSRKGAQGGDQDGARGGSALVNACRTVVTVERMTAEEHGRIHPTLEKEKYVRLVGAKANYAGRLQDKWLEFQPTLLANGDWSVAFVGVTFGEIDAGFDVETWEHRSAFLELVRRGTGERPWSAARSGSKQVRLEHAVTQDFGVDLGQARKIIEAFAERRLIAEGDFTSKSRDHSNVWIIPGEDLPPRTIEMPM